MAFDPRPGQFYRMPVFFGPMPGPRQWPAERTFDFSQTPRRKVAGVRFLSDAKQLEAMLPTGFSLWGEPVVTVEISYMTDIGWLAGRGYNMCDVKFEAVYKGSGKPVYGTLVLVRWENLADPIITGREELGHNKLYCEIPEMRTLDGKYKATMSWLSVPFLDIAIEDLVEERSAPRDARHAGMLSYKYIPRTGEWGKADVEYATLSPHTKSPVTTLMHQCGTGSIGFHRATWADLPTLYTVVNAFADLEQRESRGAYLFEQVGGASHAATHRLY